MRLVALDVARFIAAMMVVMFHFGALQMPVNGSFFFEVAKFGYLGAPIFFIISGFVILVSAAGRSAGEFAVARFVRLYPTFWFCLAVTITLMFLSGLARYTASGILANMTMLNNFLHVKDIDGVYWTLHSEMKFYGVIFLLLAVGFLKKYRVWVGVWAGFTVAKLVVGHVLHVGRALDMGCSPFFMSGVVMYLIMKDGMNRFNGIMLAVSVLLTGIKGFEQASDYMIGVSTLDRVLSVAIVLAFQLFLYLLARGKFRPPEMQGLVILGGMTYPLYLLHNRAGNAVRFVLQRYLPAGAAVAAAIAVVLGVSFVIHVLFERNVVRLMKAFLLKKYGDVAGRLRRG